MSKPNISATMTDQEKQQIKSALNNIRQSMSFIVNLNSGERKNLFKMGSGSVGFVEEALNTSKNHGAILPTNFNVPEFEKDVNLTASLQDIYSVLLPLTEGVSDTLMAVGSEAIKQANVVYSQVKMAAKNDSNMKEIQNRLGERYKKAGRNIVKPGNQN